MDYLILESSKGGYTSVLVMTDHITKFTIAIPTNSQSAANTAKLILQHFVYRFGISHRLHSDQGGTVLLIQYQDAVPTISCMGAILIYHWTLSLVLITRVSMPVC